MKLKFKSNHVEEWDVKFLKVDAGGFDGENENPPFVENERWKVIIDVETGIIQDWPKGVTAEIYEKVRDEGKYSLIGVNGEDLIKTKSYVPKCLQIEEKGYGDYIIININEAGKIRNWKFSGEDIKNIIESDFDFRE